MRSPPAQEQSRAALHMPRIPDAETEREEGNTHQAGRGRKSAMLSTAGRAALRFRKAQGRPIGETSTA